MFPLSSSNITVNLLNIYSSPVIGQFNQQINTTVSKQMFYLNFICFVFFTTTVRVFKMLYKMYYVITFPIINTISAALIANNYLTY